MATIRRNSILGYATRDYENALAQLETNPETREYPARFKRLFAGVFDVLNNTLNAVANSLFLGSLFSRPAAQDMLKLIDYELGGKETSQAPLDIEIDSALTVAGSYTLATSALTAQEPATGESPARTWEARESITFLQGETVRSAQFFQQETQPTRTLIDETGGDSWQEFDLPDVSILPETLSLVIDGETYSRVFTFAGSSSTDRHYKFIQLSDDRARVKLGGIDEKNLDQYGYLPPAGLSVFATYATGGGATTRVTAGSISQYTGGDSGVIAITQTAEAVGGRDAESLENAKEVAPLSLRANSGFAINKSSFQALARQVAGVRKVQTEYAGQLETDVFLIPNGGGIPSPSLKAELEQYLTDRTPLEAVTVNVLDPQFIDQAIAFQVSIFPGFDYAERLKYIKLAASLRTHEAADQVTERFFSEGLTGGVFVEINTILGPLTGEIYGGEDDAGEIIRILENVPVQSFGENLNPGDIITAVQGFVAGVDVVTMERPFSTVVVSVGQIVRPVSLEVSQG